MRIALCHRYNIKEEYFVLEKENITIKEIIRIIAKILIIEDEIDTQSPISTKEKAKILMNYYGFSSDLKGYEYKELKNKGKIFRVDFRKIKRLKKERHIYIMDKYLLWEHYICGENYLGLEKEIEENKDGLTGKLYKTIYEEIFKVKMTYLKNSIAELEKVPKSEKLKKWFQEEENGEKI
ncbi:hypothetical protein [Fusobacterium ulcerans]|uniref:hypothetical protein n=1 Tax=Fusobacterium ulcerans TaxID=861 RepID=UPI002672A8DA|nr:hypothetical protein [Fusobacterium ulcerans]